MEYYLKRGKNIAQKQATSLRLPPESIEKISKIAGKRHLSVRTLMRVWILERLDEEQETSAPEALAGIGTEARTEPAIKEVCPNA